VRWAQEPVIVLKTDLPALTRCISLSLCPDEKAACSPQSCGRPRRQPRGHRSGKLFLGGAAAPDLMTRDPELSATTEAAGVKTVVCAHRTPARPPAPSAAIATLALPHNQLVDVGEAVIIAASRSASPHPALTMRPHTLVCPRLNMRVRSHKNPLAGVSYSALKARLLPFPPPMAWRPRVRNHFTCRSSRRKPEGQKVYKPRLFFVADADPPFHRTVDPVPPGSSSRKALKATKALICDLAGSGAYEEVISAPEVHRSPEQHHPEVPSAGRCGLYAMSTTFPQAIPVSQEL